MLRHWHRKILIKAFPERDFSEMKKMNGRGKARVYIAGGYCYKIFLRRDMAAALREATMARILREHIDDVAIPDMQLLEIARVKRVVLHYRLIEGELVVDVVPRATERQKWQLAEDIGALLARVHTIDLRSIPPQLKAGLAAPPPRVVRAWQLRRVKPLLEERYRPYLDDHARFLENGAIYPHPHLLHGDFHLHNILATNGRVTGLIDFGCSQITTESYRDFRKVMYAMDRDFEDRLIRSYEAVSGAKVDTSQVAAGLVARLCMSNWWVPLWRWSRFKKTRLHWAMQRLV